MFQGSKSDYKDMGLVLHSKYKPESDTDLYSLHVSAIYHPKINFHRMC